METKMDLKVALESLEKFVSIGRDLKSFAEGGEMHAVFDELAKVQGKAAARAIADRSQSQYPNVELTAAVTLLRNCYENYKHNADKKTFSDRLLDTFGYQLRARIDDCFAAATAALTVAEVYALLKNQSQFDVWLNRARSDMKTYLERSELEEPKFEEYIAQDPETGGVKYSTDLYVYQNQLQDRTDKEKSFEDAYKKVSKNF
jgi:hypothetical protein